ncbi:MULTISPECIES: BglG family transcription antiterminator [Virgibacillus]|uniref:LicABCH operon regulator n=2 Tax=Virgibacillus TaxID=84406 RepID=A0ABQ2DIP5_9BACI|nr:MULTISPECIES: BglG family transcription antiterminator [Virgibacillus]EQB37646.1 hypothetical protein M948_03585 [Virgibacillus sp. CM-4]MYL40386.1 PRD domain-containing protein [Virgibacillus massiliensis]GGJ59433.1 putative licABCH operon regulator [Virgibacillus kapii]CDQ38827.1 putative licABCH operon regulator [Virgibacillus massiliensis]
MLTLRMRMILKKMMIADAPVTGAFLADLNNVTSRTTRGDIKKLDDQIQGYGAKIETIMGKGYKLAILDETRFRDFLHRIAYHELPIGIMHPQTPEERETEIIRRLLVSNDYVKLEQLADELFVSKSTVQNDLKQVKRILQRYSIHLKSRPNYGLRLEGEELKIRFCMAEYIVERNDDRGEQPMEKFIDSIEKEDVESISQVIIRQIRNYHISMSDIAIQNLVVHIAIAFQRIRSGNHITLQSSEVKQIRTQYEYQVAARIVKKVEQHFQVAFPLEETAYIAIHLLGTKMLSEPNKAEVLDEHMISENILAIIRKMLHKVEGEYNLGIEHDKELIIALGLHLKPAINRYKYGMNIRNPLLEEIKRKYPLAFEAGILAGLVIEEETGSEIDENEIGYIALHIGAAIERKNFHTGPKRCLIVCASGFGTAQLIYYKVKTEFKQTLDVVGITERYKLHEYPLHEIDVIISSVPIASNISVPVVEVSAILGSSDLERIEQFINNQGRITTYFQKHLMFLREDLVTKDEVLEFLYHQLFQLGMVQGDFLNYIYQREKIAPTSYGNLVAIPHPITPQTNETFLTVCTLKKPVLWGTKPVQFICLLNVKKDSKEDLQQMYELLGSIVNSEITVQQLIKSTTYQAFIQELQ